LIILLLLLVLQMHQMRRELSVLMAACKEYNIFWIDRSGRYYQFFSCPPKLKFQIMISISVVQKPKKLTGKRCWASIFISGK
jgi:hypothetical protein